MAGRGGRGDHALVRVHDEAGRPRGAGIVADHHGTVLTSHETVEGLDRIVLHTATGRHCRVAAADAVTLLPELDLAIVRTEGLDADPAALTAREAITAGAYVRIAADGWREARVLGTTGATYTAGGRSHALDGVLELAIGTAGRDALRRGGGAAGGPVVDAATGAVVAVLATGLRCADRDTGFAVPLRRAPGAGPLAELLARNAATVPAYGADLNLAGVLELTATSVGQDGPPAGGTEPVERTDVARELTAFTAGPAAVLGLVGPPGSGRTTELAALADRRARGDRPAPTLWLRGADLADADASLADAARRALTRAARIVAASASACPDDLGDTGPERLATLAHEAGRPLLLLLDSPEEMPPLLAHRLAEWTAGTAAWLTETGARLVVACREEYWEVAGAHFPAGTLHTARRPDGGAGGLPPCLRLGDLTPGEAREARARLGLPEDALTASDARHPLALRLLAEVRAALPDAPAGAARLDRHEVFAAHLDLLCLRVAVRLAAGNGLRGTAVRRLAAKVAGQVHQAARRSLGPGHGELDRETFETLFPWGPAPATLGGGTGWASAVLAEGLLVPAGGGYRFAHEELADWLHGTHLDLDEALRTLVRGGVPHPLPVPHHRIGPVVQALLLVARQHGTHQLASRLLELLGALEDDPDSWWAARLLAEVLRRVPDATPYVGVLRLLADALAGRLRQRVAHAQDFAPDFWTGLPLPRAERVDLLRRLLPADPPHRLPADAPLRMPADAPHRGLADSPTCAGAYRAPAARHRGHAEGRYLDAAARLLVADPAAVQPLLTRWFDDDRPLPSAPDATVATAAQALLHTHRHRAPDALTEALADSGHRRADELLAVLAQEEPAALCRAVDRWAHDERPARRAAAVTYGLRAAAHARTETDRDLLQHAAFAVLARPAETGLHGGALGILLHDPHTRARHLPRALERLVACDPGLPPEAAAAALATHPEPVLDAFRTRLARPDPQAALLALADAAMPPLAHRVAALIAECVTQRPETAACVARWVDSRPAQGPAARTAAFALVTALKDTGPPALRAALSDVLPRFGAPDARDAAGETPPTTAGSRAPGHSDHADAGRTVPAWHS